MKARRTTKKRAPSSKARGTPTRGDFPLLADFFRGYLHQDFVLEHGSPAGALAAYRRDLGPAENDRLTREAAEFRRGTRGRSLADLQRLLADEFRSAWRPPSARAVETLLAD